jgi:hypothetical protein
MLLDAATFLPSAAFVAVDVIGTVSALSMVGVPLGATVVGLVVAEGTGRHTGRDGWHLPGSCGRHGPQPGAACDGRARGRVAMKHEAGSRGEGRILSRLAEC